MKKDNLDNKKIISAVIGIFVLLAVGTGVYFVLKSPIMNRGSVKQAVASKEIILKTQADIDKYFTYMTQPEAEALLASETQSGKKAFLFPSVDLVLNGNTIEIKEEAANIEGKDTVFLTFNGLVDNTKVYTTGECTVIGGVSQVFNWAKEVDLNQSAYTRSIYVGMSSAASGIKTDLSGDIYTPLSAGENILTYVVAARPMEIPVKAQIAYAIGDGSVNNNFATFGNMLQKNGRIVLVKR